MLNDRKNIPIFINNFKTTGFDDYTFIALLQINFSILFMPNPTTAIGKLAQNLNTYSNPSKVQRDIVLTQTVTSLFLEKADNDDGKKAALWFLIDIACVHLRSNLHQDFLNRIIEDIICVSEETNNNPAEIKNLSKALQDMLGLPL